MSNPDWELERVELPFEVVSQDQLGPGGPMSGLPPGDPGFLIFPAAGVDEPARWVSGEDIRQVQADLMATVSNLINLVPVVGQVKGLAEAFAGEDLITGEKKAWWEAALDVAAIIPVMKGAQGVKMIVGTIGRVAGSADLVVDTTQATLAVDKAFNLTPERNQR